MSELEFNKNNKDFLAIEKALQKYKNIELTTIRFIEPITCYAFNTKVITKRYNICYISKKEHLSSNIIFDIFGDIYWEK